MWRVGQGSDCHSNKLTHGGTVRQGDSIGAVWGKLDLIVVSTQMNIEICLPAEVVF